MSASSLLDQCPQKCIRSPCSCTELRNRRAQKLSWARMKLPPTRKTRNLHASQYFSMLLSMLPMDHPFALTTTLVVGLLVPFFFIWSLRMNSIASILSKWISQWAFPRMDDSSIVGTGPYYDSSLLQSLKILESNWELIQREVDTKLMPQLDHLYSLNRHLKPTEHTDTIAQSQQQQQERQVPLDRKAFFFSIFGYSFESSRQYFPETTAVLDTIPGGRASGVCFHFGTAIQNAHNTSCRTMEQGTCTMSSWTQSTIVIK